MITAWMTLANLAFLASFLARDVLMLRVACVLGSLLLILSFLAMDDVPWVGVGWQVVFVVIHGVWSARLWQERRPVELTSDERALADGLFPGLPARKVAALVRRGRWHQGDAGLVLCNQGAQLGELLLLVDGEAQVERDGVAVAGLRGPRFVGEVGYLLGHPASAGVRARSKVRFLTWPVAALKGWTADDAELRSALQQAIGDDLARKLGRRTNSGRPAV